MGQKLYDRPPASNEHRFMDYTASTVTFFADVNHNGTIDEVKYNVANGTVTRSVAVATVSPPNLPYTDQFGAFSTPLKIASGARCRYARSRST